ncbi:hypothetical protein Q5P01_026370 [Channa striata]|uniref:Uncharacterized protein n=1 Tax=Channa striata TaxID=64152 RepID=A0AA88IK32_CHASR|nr:hypothetical protein Q5P01_026370 [Channa striata]
MISAAVRSAAHHTQGSACGDTVDTQSTDSALPHGSVLPPDLTQEVHHSLFSFFYLSGPGEAVPPLLTSDQLTTL